MNLKERLKRFKIIRAVYSGVKGTAGLLWGLLKNPAIALNIADYYLNPLSLRRKDINETNISKIREELEQNGINVKKYKINAEKFRKYLKETKYPQDYIDGYNNFKKDCFIEKALEHFIAEELLEFNGADVYADIAAANSPTADIVRNRYGCASYRIDQSYAPGINGGEIEIRNSSPAKRGGDIGADAADTKLPGGFCTKISLHCAYEEFENDNDIKLLPEMHRLLRPGGKAIILPLYIHHFPFIDSDPFADLRGVKYNDGQRVWRTDCAGLRCSRKYSVDTLKKRIINNLGRFKYSIYYVENIKEINPVCYCYFALLMEK